VAGQGPGPDGVSFPFPEDQGGALLARVLSPEGSPPPRPGHSRADPGLPEPALPEGVDTPALPPAADLMPPPRLPAPGRARPLRPWFVARETLDPLPGEVAVPEAPRFAVGPRLRVPALDVNEPPPLPLLGRRVPDRASLEDATGSASAQAALAAKVPQRTTPALFLRLTLPDPYEHRRPLGVRVPAEETTPAARSPQAPQGPQP
jgi:hypothetical protein